MSRLFSGLLLAASLAIASGADAGPAGGQGDAGRTVAVLHDAGQTIELRGLRTRVVAFYEYRGGSVSLTVLMSGGSLGREVLRASLGLSDGQRHAVMMDGGDGNGMRERFSFTRRGGDVEVAFEQVAPLPAARVGAVTSSGATRLASLNE
ncbi:hypothetical protein M1105_14215 [Limibaculum sp. FT325]|uniref:hypothetical protein n=1 Tax=Thermohalobaculum sediminis TaxID=2939436 RepID=UPI0020BD9CF9|nr:hypothetical protein [Limibaculum sediminis]MCL5778134.1 hypothetical protein [Limibaculum sediminis]